MSDLFAWGSCEDGQLGFKSSDSCQVLMPTALPSNNNTPQFSQVACGYKHTLFLTPDGKVYSCGCNEYEQLGYKESSEGLKLINAFGHHRITSIACGAYHNGAITYEGILLTWGCNSSGQLGRKGEDTGVQVVSALSNHRIVQISMGVEHTLVLTDTSRLFTFGANSKGQLGLGYASTDPVFMPQELLSLSSLPIRLIAVGGWHSLVLTVSGSLYAWGSNNRGQLGLGYVGSSADKSDNAMDCSQNSTGRDPPSKRRQSSPSGISQTCVPIPSYVRTLKGHEIVFVTCGEAHTAVLTRDGSVFTFGSGRYGQLGHNESVIQVPFPRKVADLMDNVVTQIACGRLHTIALVPQTGRMYAFGAGNEGQLGCGDPSNQLYPVRVKGPWIPSTGQIKEFVHDRQMAFNEPRVVRKLFSGGDHVFIIVQKPTATGIVDDFRQWDKLSAQSILNLCRETITQIRSSLNAKPLPPPRPNSRSSSSLLSSSDYSDSRSLSSQSLSPLERLRNIFSSLGCLSASCLSEKHFQTGRNEHGLDLDMAHDIQSQLFTTLAQGDLYQLTGRLISILKHRRTNFPSIECLRSYLLLAVSDLLCMPPEFANYTRHAFREDGTYDDQFPIPFRNYSLFSNLTDTSFVIIWFCVAINSLDSAPSKIFDTWLTKLQPRYLKKLVLYLNCLVTYLLEIIKSDESKSKLVEEKLEQVLKLMGRLYKVNRIHPNPISYSSFQIPSLKTQLNIVQMFLKWLQERRFGANHSFSFCDYPFVFLGPMKAEMLRIEAQQFHMSEAFVSFDQLILPMDRNCFLIQVRRDHLIEDTLTALAMSDETNFRKRLRVQFENEEALDDGGVMKEFFLLLFRDILSPVYGMFKCYPESQMLWFSESTMENESVFRMVGILCGLAIYNSIIVDLSFPLAMFRKLLGETPTLEDLKELDPIVGRSIQQILDYDGDDLKDVFWLTFSVQVDYFGENRVIPLIENGEDIYVTQENKTLYAEKYVDYVFNKSCAKPYEAFAMGFQMACRSYSLKFFQPIELQALVVGSELMDWTELRRIASYEGVYWDRHPIIEWFWEVLLKEFNLEQKKLFLRFVTGCDRVPIIGFGGMKLIIRGTVDDDRYLPVAHTCANMLDLPRYSSKEILARKLSQAILQTEGFALV